MAVGVADHPVTPKMILVDQQNQFVEYLGTEKPHA